MPTATTSSSTSSTSLRVDIVPCLNDNYGYLIVDEARGQCAIVDASETKPVLDAIARVGLPLAAILSTHHHHDHVGGNAEVLAAHPKAIVYGHSSDQGRIPGLTHPLEDGATFELGSFSVTARHVPGHTLGAVTYVVSDGDGPAWAFTGDTLFVAGCGRLFEGTPAQMHRSLCGILAELPPDTRVACGHEYTAANLKFAAHVEPQNTHVAAKIAAVAALRAKGEPTVPGTIGEEREINPFLRVDVPAVRTHVGADASTDSSEVLRLLREEKNSFK